MFEFAFAEEFTWIFMIISGLVGFLYSGERLVAVLPFWGDLEDTQTKMMGYLSITMGVVAAVWMSLLILDDVAQFSWLTIVLLTAFMIVSLAHPVKELEGWTIILLAIPFILVTILAFWFKNDRQFVIFGTTINLWAILGLVTIIMLLLFVLVFFIEESFVDPVLFFLGWAPIVFIVCVLVILHGLALVVYPIDGLLEALGIAS